MKGMSSLTQQHPCCRVNVCARLSRGLQWWGLASVACADMMKIHHMWQQIMR